MADRNGFVDKPAFQVPAGHAVARRGPHGTLVLCLKGQRPAKRYVQDYAVALAPVAEGGPRLDFIDPEEQVTDCAVRLAFVAGPQAAPSDGRLHARPGDLVESARGLWLAVAETDGPSQPVAFIQVETGEVRRLREGAIRAVYRHWRIDAPAAVVAAFPGLAAQKSRSA